MACSSIDSLLRSSQAYCQQVCGKQTLDYGIAFFSERFPSVSDVNQFREVWIDDAAHVSLAFEEAERWFAGNALRCLRWAPAGGQPSEALSAYLVERGFERRDYAALMLTSWPTIEADASVRVLPARAMRAALRVVMEQSLASIAEPERSQAIEVMEERLDDPPYDMFVAMADKQPAGCCALYQVGDLVRVMDLHVTEPARYEAVAGGLLVHVLVLARRLAMRNVVAQVPVDDLPRRSLFETYGFEVDGTFTEFERPFQTGPS